MGRKKNPKADNSNVSEKNEPNANGKSISKKNHLSNQQNQIKLDDSVKECNSFKETKCDEALDSEFQLVESKRKKKTTDSINIDCSDNNKKSEHNDEIKATTSNENEGKPTSSRNKKKNKNLNHAEDTNECKKSFKEKTTNDKDCAKKNQNTNKNNERIMISIAQSYDCDNESETIPYNQNDNAEMSNVNSTETKKLDFKTKVGESTHAVQETHSDKTSNRHVNTSMTNDKHQDSNQEQSHGSSKEKFKEKKKRSKRNNEDSYKKQIHGISDEKGGKSQTKKKNEGSSNEGSYNKPICGNIGENIYKGKKSQSKKYIENIDDKSSNKSNNRSKTSFHEGRCQSPINDETCIFEEIDEDLFKLPKDVSLAHCVAEDLRMGAGIAVDFKRYFGGVGKLIDQKLVVGDVGIVYRHDQFAFYLITKKISSCKPTMSSLSKALETLLKKLKEHNLTKLGIPKIGCGLDGLDWSEVKSLIKSIFSGSGIHITACLPSKILDSKTPPPLKVFITPKNLWEMEEKTDIILFIDLELLKNNNWTNDLVDKVNARYPFKESLLKDIKNKGFNPGEISQYSVKSETITCAFISQCALYTSLEDVAIKIKSKMKNYKYFAIQSESVESNFKHISWIVLILRSIITSSELWLCGDPDQTESKVFYDMYCKTLFRNSRNFNSTPNSNEFRSRMSFNQNNSRHSYCNTGEKSNQNWRSNNSSSALNDERK